MKKIILFLFFTISSLGQNYKILYGKSIANDVEDLEKIKDVNVKNNIISINQSFEQLDYELLINNNFGIFKYIKTLKMPGFNPRAITVGGGNGIHYYDKKNNLTIFETEMTGKKYFIKSDINKYNWRITTESKTINDFLCYRATAIIEYDDFRGKEKHEIEAWFCPEIPFSYGPDIYYGLPGLIFEANYVNSKVKFYLKSIVKLDSQIPLTLPNENAITEEEFTAIFNAEMKKLTEEN